MSKPISWERARSLWETTSFHDGWLMFHAYVPLVPTLQRRTHLRHAVTRAVRSRA